MRELSFVFREKRRPVMALTTLTRLLSSSSIESRPTPLTQAAKPGLPARTRQTLLLCGSDPVESGRHAWPPLAWAARGGHLEAIRTSVRIGVDFDRPGNGQEGWTPQIRAIHRGQPPIVCACAGAPPPAYAATI